MNSPAKMFFKVAAAVLIDSITLILFCFSWSVVRWELLPFALLAVLIALVLMNGAILLSGPLATRFGIAAYISLLVATLLYFAAVIAYTLVLYLFVSVRSYLLIFFVQTLVYVLIVFGLYIAGSNRAGDTRRMASEKADTADVTKKLLILGETVRSCESAVSREAYQRLWDAYALLDERIKASTPFGRSGKTDVSRVERQILLAIASLQETAAMVSASPTADTVCDNLTADMVMIKNMVMNREKLILL